jgi:photosystem II stability/assembly factor-like uncharacterized protein
MAMKPHDGEAPVARPTAGSEADEVLLRRWRSASGRAAPAPVSNLYARLGSGRGIRAGRRVVAAVSAAVVLVIAVAGAGLWVSYRLDTAPAAGVSPTRTSALPYSTGTGQPPEIALGVHEGVVQMARTGAGGWVLTTGRLLLYDGASWRVCWNSPAGNSFAPRSLAAIEGASIYIVYGSKLWSGTQSCTGWTVVDLPFAPTSIAFPTPEIGYIAAGSTSDPAGYAQIDRTVDGGRHWTGTVGRIKAGSGQFGSPPLSFVDADHGWITDNRTLWYTANGGGSWSAVHLPVPSSVTPKFDSVDAPVVGTGGSAVVVAKYDRTPGMDGAAGQRVFYQTTDGGAHWSAVAVIADSGLIALSLPSPTTWIVRDRTVVRSTTDAGTSWRSTQIQSGHPADAKAASLTDAISFSDPDHGWLVYGDPEPPCPGPTYSQIQVQPICDYAFPPPQHVVATEDGGATWREILP